MNNPSSIFFPLTSIYNKTGKFEFKLDQMSIAYEVKNKTILVAGDPKAKGLENKILIFKKFIIWCKTNNFKICGYYFSQEFSLQVKIQFDFKSFQVGTSSFVYLPDYTLVGDTYKEVRRAINYAAKNNLKFIEITKLKKEYINKIDILNKDWEKEKSKNIFFKRIKFLLSSPKVNFNNSQKERWFVVELNNDINAFVSLLPYSNNLKHYYLDNMIQSPSGDKFAMDYLFSQVILKLKKEKVLEICFGFNLARGIELSSILSRMIVLIFKTRVFYNASGLGYFKNKFNTFEKKRYFILENDISIFKALLTTYKITFK